MVYPEQMNQPTWAVGQLNHTQAVVLLMIHSDSEMGEYQRVLVFLAGLFLSLWSIKGHVLHPLQRKAREGKYRSHSLTTGVRWESHEVG